LAWPDWMEDLRRCHEQYGMAGLRIYPSYQTFNLDHPEFRALLQEVAKRGMILQIVGDMEDSRNHHPITETRDINFGALLDAAKEVPNAKIQLLYWNHRVNAHLMSRNIRESQILFDTARIEASGGLGRMISGHLLSINATRGAVEPIFFGSQAPYFPVQPILLKIIESHLTLDQARSIMNVNAQLFINHLT